MRIQLTSTRPLSRSLLSTVYCLLSTGRLRRRAFTLVEMLVVILIIGVLASLITAAVVKALGKGRDVRVRSEIANLDTAVETFRSTYGFYPPSRIKLCEKLSDYGTTPLDTDSIAIIRRMFPRIDTTVWNTGIDWNGNNNPTPDGPVTLEGDQCLVFFLGGIPGNYPAGLPPACTGFSTNPANPTSHVASATLVPTKPPLFEFDGSRLVFAHGAGSLFYSYLDYWGLRDPTTISTYTGSPYAYFSSYGRRNGYNPYVISPGGSDCASLRLGGVWPYAEAVPAGAPPRYVNPERFQIISAGPDQGLTSPSFGTGTVLTVSGGVVTGGAPVWNRANPSATYPKPADPGIDDMSNFYDGHLGQ